jgi:hypothetical protein
MPMNKDKYNAEGYPDLTAYEAIRHASRAEGQKGKQRKLKRPPLVYICSPYAGEIEKNVQNARRYCRFAARQNCLPLAPHLHYPQFLDDSNPHDRALGLSFGLTLLGLCAKVWVFGGRVSSGMAAEIAKAKKRGIPIRYFNEKCEEVKPYA